MDANPQYNLVPNDDRRFAEEGSLSTNLSFQSRLGYNF